jgi:hypothetical protein
MDTLLLEFENRKSGFTEVRFKINFKVYLILIYYAKNLLIPSLTPKEMDCFNLC